MTSELMEIKPSDLVEIDTVMTNFDHHIEKDVAEKLKTGKYFAQYAAWGFCGYVWWNKTKWSCEIWTYHLHVKTISADTLEEIMDEASSEFGSK